ncbi:formylglycine-generating enzyme family protein [Candidatus Poribacteria bacterium]|nr:formylglycine-generating enzyme family protein [Candidatus Poribacteria bacterium]
MQKSKFTIFIILLCAGLLVTSVFAQREPQEKPQLRSESPQGGPGQLTERVSPTDGAKMVLIPAGEFWMGTDAKEIPQLVQWTKKYYSDAQASGFEYETPRHKVYVDAFYIDKYEVTNAQYQKFMRATGHPKPMFWDDSGFNAPTQPVVGVTWYDAMAYAKWAGKRLPTEAEWEKAARGGLEGKKFPWGDQDPDGSQCNFADKNAPSSFTWADRNANDGYQYTAPVGKYSPNGYGLYDMAGNVWEWCLDEYDGGFYAKSSGRNPVGGATNITDIISDFTNVETLRSLRGGGWYGDPGNVRVANRISNSPTDTNHFLGFRCAGSVTP